MSRKTATIDRLVEPVVRILTPDLALAFIQLRADPDLQARMDQLAEKCNEGQLTADEREGYEPNIQFGNFIAILQAKARAFLRRQKTRCKGGRSNPPVGFS
jgi:hypothetical protein